jgi:DNA-binding CsgD family transcriptional regulator
LTRASGARRLSGMDADLVRYAGSLAAAASVDELLRACVAGFPKALDAEMYGCELLDRRVRVGVSDAFAAAYAPALDPVRERALSTGRPAYNLALMSQAEWEACAVYRDAYRLHGIRHLVKAPVVGTRGVLGMLYCASAERAFRPEQLALADAVAGVLAAAVERIERTQRRERERDELAAALELTTAPVVRGTSMNAAARRLLAQVVDAEACLYRLLARPAHGGAFSRRLEVETVSGETGVLEAASTPVNDGLVTVLAMPGEATLAAPGVLGVLTPREADVAKLVADGLADREIAARLYLSHHTVGQHVKRIYRKLDVDSRVSLTRLLLARAA